MKAFRRWSLPSLMLLALADPAMAVDAAYVIGPADVLDVARAGGGLEREPRVVGGLGDLARERRGARLGGASFRIGGVLARERQRAGERHRRFGARHLGGRGEAEADREPSQIDASPHAHLS